MGYGLNRFAGFVLRENAPITAAKDSTLKLDKEMLQTGDYKTYWNIYALYINFDYPTKNELLLDYIIAFNRYHTPGIAKEIFKIIVPLSFKSVLPSNRKKKREAMILGTSYTLYNMGCNYLYRAAKGGDTITIFSISNILEESGIDNEKLDSFPRKIEYIGDECQEYIYCLMKKNNIVLEFYDDED